MLSIVVLFLVAVLSSASGIATLAIGGWALFATATTAHYLAGILDATRQNTATARELADLLRGLKDTQHEQRLEAIEGFRGVGNYAKATAEEVHRLRQQVATKQPPNG